MSVNGKFFQIPFALILPFVSMLNLQSAGCADWPVSRGNPSSTGVANSSIPSKPDVLWEYKTGDDKAGFEGTPVIADGRVFVGDFEGNVRAIQLNDGSEIWKVKTKDGFVTAAAIHLGKVVICDFNGIVYCFEATTGTELWKKELDQQACGINFFEDDVLVAMESGTMTSLDLLTGEPKWLYKTGDQLRTTATIWKNVSLLGGCDGRLHKIDLLKGEAIGDGIALNAPTLSTPNVIGNVAIVPTQPGVVMAIDVESNKILWTFSDPDVASDVQNASATMGTAEGDMLKGITIVNTRNKRVVGLNLADGTLAWEPAILKKRSVSAPIICDGRAWVTGTDGMIHAIDLKTGKISWSYQLSGQIIASPAIADDRLLIATEKGSVVCFGKK